MVDQIINQASILSNLNPAQKEAVTWGHSPLLVHAGAGSGKTRILTRRIAYLILQGVPAFNILGVTFTNKAAQEMKTRVGQLVSQDVWVSTFHSTCLRILRMDGPTIGIDRYFSIYDEHDQLVLIRECIKELNMNEKQIHPKGVRERIQRAKDVLITPFQYAEKSSDMYEDAVSKIYKLYEEKMTRLKALDFGDLIMKTALLFDRSAEVLKTWQARFQHILIDEYQDTNHAQYRLIKLLAQAKRQITVVGDPDQSIYAWRGADIKNILNFEKDYPEAGIIRMEQNYRSTSVILNAANELIGRNEMRKPKALWTERQGGEKINVFESMDEKHEAEYVVNRILNYNAEGKTLADQVVFYRVHAQSRILEDTLRRAKIPYKIVGGIRFYDRKEIKDLVAYLKAIANPHDDVSLKRILNVPTRGIGKKAMETLEEIARKENLSFDQVLATVEALSFPRKRESIGSKLDPPVKPGDDKNIIQLKTRATIAHFYSLLNSLRKDAKHLSVEDLLHRILERTGYVQELENEKTIESQARIENIEEFFSVIEDFEENYSEITSPACRTGGSATPPRNDQDNVIPAEAGISATKMADPSAIFGGHFGSKLDPPVKPGDDIKISSPLQFFLESISLMTDLDTWESGTNALTLMTLHTAKGLEFPIVYMVGLEEGIFPNVNAYTDNRDDLEEERRLCYVGITRAKDKLHISYARERRLYGTRQHNLPSRFLTEIPAELLDSRCDTASFETPRNREDIDIDFDQDEIKRRILFD